MGYRVKPFTMAVRDNSTQQFIDVGLLGSDVDAEIEEFREEVEEQFKITESIAGKNSRVLAHRGYTTDNNPYCQDNSVFAFVNAGVNGFNGIEVDPRKDVNNVLVCLHNPYVDDISTSTGNISELSYLDVKYKTKANTETNVHLTTVREMLAIAKFYNFFVLFDMGKEVVTCQEIVTECENSDFYNYGFFNVTNVSELLTVPEYVIKVLGNDVFVHTESELDGYISSFGSSKNLCVRILTATATDEQIQLIKSKGFLILANFDQGSRIGTCTETYVSMIDFILGDYTPSAITGPFTVELQHVYNDIKTYADSLAAPCFTVVQAIGSSGSLPSDQNFYVYIHKASNNFIKLIAIRVFGSDEAYILTKVSGSWDSNWTNLWNGLWANFNIFTKFIDTTESTYNITLYGYAVGKTVTISALRETNHVSSTGWTTIGTIPVAYAPPTTLTSYCTDGTGNRLIFRVNEQGAIMIWTIPAQQIACVITYAIA